MKKVAIIGKGTAGALSALHMSTYMKDCEFDWYYDDSIPTQAVGEGANLVMPRKLFHTLNFYPHNLQEIDGTIKSGIFKSGWSENDFMHTFIPPEISYHFNAVKLQNYIFEKIHNRFSLKEGNIKHQDIDADFIMDCSGKPDDLSQYEVADYIPVNSVHVTQCEWEYPRFQYTLTIARPYGWVFGIPLTNRCSIGYLYNKNINTLEEVKEDVKNVLDQYNLVESYTNSFSFNNYYRKENFSSDGRIAYNGNNSFFLEPLEATSIQMIDYVQRMAYDIWHKNIQIDFANSRYHKLIKQIENMIMIHYISDNKFDNDFWKFARERGFMCYNRLINDEDFHLFYNNVLPDEYGTWTKHSFKCNFEGLNIS